MPNRHLCLSRDSDYFGSSHIVAILYKLTLQEEGANIVLCLAEQVNEKHNNFLHILILL